MVNVRNIALLIFAIALGLYAAGQADMNLKYEPGVIIVKFKSQGPAHSLHKSQAAIQSLLQQYSVKSVEKVFPEQQPPGDSNRTDLSSLHVLMMPENYDAVEAARAFAQNDNVEYAQPNYIQTVYEVPNDPLWDDLYYLPQIKAEAAWDLTHGDSSVVIAIIDTGVDYDHEDLQDDIWTNEAEILDGIDNDGNGKVDDIHGWDFVESAANAAPGEDDREEDNDPDDGHGHGTMVAGLAAGVTNNGIGVASIGWNCEIMPLRAGYKNKQGTGSIISLAANKAIKYAVENGASIINASWGLPVNDRVTTDVMRYAFENNVVVVKASGNSNDSQAYLPDSAPFVLSVAAVDDRDNKAVYSNYGEWIDISAPGGNLSGGRPGIITTIPDDFYTQNQGTSLSAPIVAGVCGLVRAVHPDWSAAKVMMHVVDTADDIDGMNPDYKGMLGKKGRVNALKSVQQNFKSQPEFSIDRVTVVDITGNGDGKLNPGETVSIVLKIKNLWNDAKNVRAVLSTTDPTVEILSSETDFPSILGLSTPGFNFMENNHQPFRIKVDERTFPHNLPFTLELTDGNGYRQQIQFQIAINAQVLFVDDDGPRHVEEHYFSVLDSIGMPYDIWNRLEQGPVETAKIKNYPIVIWSCEKELPTLNEDDRKLLQSYLANGGKLFIAGQDIGWDLNDPQNGQITNYNEYIISRGASKVFYEGNLRAIYADNKSPFSFVTGQQNDPIGQDLEFAVFEPGHSNSDQSPDVIIPHNGSTSIFNYPDGASAAVRYDGDYQLVYFSFGGIEAISQEQARAVVMERILNFFTGLNVTFTDISGSEQTESDFPVKAHVETEKAIDSVRLFYRTLNESYFTAVPMTQESDSIYVASIPAQDFGTTVCYTVLVESEDGFYSQPTFRQFEVKYTAPWVDGITQVEKTLFAKPFLKMLASDASGIDTTSGYLHFWKSGQPHDSLVMDYLGAGEFGQFMNSQHSFGDSLNYQFSVKDLSAKKLTGYSDIFSIKLGFEDFENEPLCWNLNESPWGRDTFRPYSGKYALHESPGQGVNYPDNANVSVQLERGLDLSGLSEATLSFYHFYGLLPGDSAFVEASRDNGKTWQRISDSFTGGQSTYKEYQCSLDAFTGAGNESVLLRFRLVSDESGNGPGWFVDDVKILPYTTAVEQKDQQELPKNFALHDNYPNPFNNSTIIQYSLPKSMHVKIEIYNLLGHKITTLVNVIKEAGMHTVEWNGQNDNGENMSTGLYFYRLRAGDFSAMKKCALVK